MRRRGMIAALVLFVSAIGCTTEQDIIDSLQNQLSSVSGDWTGSSTAQNSITLDFHLTEGSNGQVTGTGTMKEANAASAVPVTITGTFQKPTLSLTFQGMQYEGHAVQGVVQGSYTSVGGITTTLQMTGTGYSSSMTILLQEK